MDAELAALPDDVDALKAALLLARVDLAQATAEVAAALAEQSGNLALIAHLISRGSAARSPSPSAC